MLAQPSPRAEARMVLASQDFGDVLLVTPTEPMQFRRGHAPSPVG